MKTALCLLQVLALVFVSACSNSESTLGSAQFSVTVPQALAGSVARVTVTASASDFPALSLEPTRVGNTWTGTLAGIPAGPLRTFRAQAFDAADVPLYDGSVTRVTITAQQTALVAILLQDVNPPPSFQNEAPIIDALVADTTTVLVNGSLNLTVTAHDPNAGDALTPAWSATAGSFSTPSAAASSWTAPASPGLYPLTVTVTDSQGLATSARLAIHVRKPQDTGSAQVTVSFNASPTVSGVAASLSLLSVGEPTLVTATAVDADGDTLSYAWHTDCPGSWTNANARSAQFTPSALPGGACNNCRLTVAVADGRGASTTGAVTLCVNDSPRINHFEPVIEFLSNSSDTASPGQTLTYEVVASDPEGTALAFAWSANTGTLGTPTTDATSSGVSWSAPACAITGLPPRIRVQITNAFQLTATRDFPVTGLPTCPPGSLPTGAMATARFNHTMTLLPNSKVLAAGGSEASASAELYNPDTGTWSPAGAMRSVRLGHTETLLRSGRVLVSGGYSQAYHSTAEVYDAETDAWTWTHNTMSVPRSYHASVLLPDGKVLSAGGFSFYYLSSTELYDPSTQTWSAASDMRVGRSLHTMTVLRDGRVLVTGGYNSYSVYSSELYDPTSGTWRTTSDLLAPRYLHTATLLPDGKVLVVGGMGYGGYYPLGSAEIYDPATGSWRSIASMRSARWGHQTLLVHGKITVMGGYDGSNYLSSVEQYDPTTDTWSAAAPLSVARREFTALQLSSGRVLIAGGFGSDQRLSSAELYLP